MGREVCTCGGAARDVAMLRGQKREEEGGGNVMIGRAVVSMRDEIVAKM